VKIIRRQKRAQEASDLEAKERGRPVRAFLTMRSKIQARGRLRELADEASALPGLMERIALAGLLGVAICTAQEQPSTVQTNLLEIQSLTADGKPIAWHNAGEQRIKPFAESLTFGFGTHSNSARTPIRLRYKLEGHDDTWHEGTAEMSLAVRFVDEAGEQIAQKIFPAHGESSGWSGDLKTSTLTHRRETVTVPPKASRLWVVISSAGPPSGVGIFVVDDLIVRRAVSREDFPDVVLRSPFDRQSPGPTNQMPAGWIRDGYRPSMAKIVELGSEVGARTFAILDEDPLGHAEWHTIKESAPRVFPGEQLVIEWNEVFTMGVGDIRTASYGKLLPGKYRFRVSEVTALGQPTGEEASISIIVPRPLWETPWFWATAVIFLVGASLSSGRYLTWRRMQREMVRLKQQRLLEQERLRIAQDIHDDLGARVTQISLLSAMAQGNAAFPESARSSFDNISQMSRELVSALYETVWAVNPENDNLDALGNYLCQMANQLCSQAGLGCRLDVVDLPQNIQLSSQMRHNITMAVKEALHNVIKHANARAVTLSATLSHGAVSISVKDDGRGFQTTNVAPGSGLTNMKRRLSDIGGTCSIQSEPGAGTTVTMRLELRPPDA
jgi:signal transduction histidine kinase